MRARKAFTIIELLVVIPVVVILAGTLLPALAVARERAPITHCANKERNFMLAFLTPFSNHDEHLPGHYWQITGYGLRPC